MKDRGKEYFPEWNNKPVGPDLTRAQLRRMRSMADAVEADLRRQRSKLGLDFKSLSTDPDFIGKRRR